MSTSVARALITATLLGAGALVGQGCGDVGGAREPTALFRGLTRPCNATPYPVYCLQQ